MIDPEKTTTPPKRQRTRSPAYPLFSLRSAVDAAEKIWKAQGKHSAHLDSVLQTIGYTKRTGASLRTISALEQFGLTKETGSADSRNIALSDLGLDIIVGSEEQKREALRTAAIKPTVYAELWSRYGEHPPADEVIRTFLIREKNFNPAVIDAIVEDYRITIDFAKLRGNGGEHEKPAVEAQATALPSPAGIPAVAQKRKEGQSPPMTQGLRYLSIPLEIGEAPVPLGMSKDDWEMFINTLKLWKSRILKPSEESSSEADSVLNELAED